MYFAEKIPLQPLAIQEFNRLPLTQKIDLVEQSGVYLEVYHYTDHGFKVALFDMHRYYCEVWLREQTDVIENVTAFTSYKKLDVYLPMVNVNPLFKMLK